MSKLTIEPLSSIDASRPLDITHLFEMGSQSFEDFVPWFVEAVNKAYSENDWLKALTQLGGSPHPGYIVKSGMPITLRNNLTRLERDMPLVYQAVTSFSPAVASLAVRAKFDDAIDNQPGEGKASMPVRDAIKDVYGAPGLRAFEAGMNVADIISGVPGHIGNQVDHLLKDAAPLVKQLGELVKVLQEIAKFIEKIEPSLDKWFEYVIKNLLPALEKLDKQVMEPYLKACEDSKQFMDDLKKEQQDNRTAVDSTIPKIVGTNFDAAKMQALATAMDLPIVGVIYRSQVGALVVARYQAQQGRGFIDDYAMMQAAMSFPSAIGTINSLLGGASSAGEVASQVPAWFLSNK